MNTQEQNRRLVEGFITAFNRDPSEETIQKYIDDDTLKDHIQEILSGMPNFSSSMNRILVEEYLAAFNRNPSEEVIDKYVEDKSYKEHVHEFLSGMPNLQIKPKFIVAEGNKVVVNALIEGEHKGMLLGAAPTGRKIQFEPIVIFEVENNKIVRHWLQADTLSLVNQLRAEELTAEPDMV